MGSDQDDRKEAGIPEMVTFTEIARRLHDREIVSRAITRQGVRHIADTDPAWPVPRSQWQKIGNAWAMPWEPIERFFRARPEPSGRGPDRAPRRRREPLKPESSQPDEKPTE